MKTRTNIAIQILTFTAVFIFAMAIGTLSGQLPTNVPSPEAEPVDFFESWGSVIFYIVIPAAIIILYFVWRRRNKKEARKKQEENSKS